MNNQGRSKQKQKQKPIRRKQHYNFFGNPKANYRRKRTETAHQKFRR